jgi:hypothetical protein
VKRIPTPIALVNGVDEGITTVTKNQLANSGGLITRMKDFDFELLTRVASFSMNTLQGGDFVGDRSTSNRLTDRMVALIQNARTGQKFFFEDIIVNMPHGPEPLSPLTITVR